MPASAHDNGRRTVSCRCEARITAEARCKCGPANEAKAEGGYSRAKKRACHGMLGAGQRDHRKDRDKCDDKSAAANGEHGRRCGGALRTDRVDERTGWDLA